MKLTAPNRSTEKMRAGLMYVGIITVITIVVWVSVGIYTSYSKPSIDKDIQAVIKPINPSLDNQVLIDYSGARIRPPEQFQIIAIVREANQLKELIIDPYSIGTPKPQTAEPASPSAVTESEEEGIIEEDVVDETPVEEVVIE